MPSATQGVNSSIQFRNILLINLPSSLQGHYRDYVCSDRAATTPTGQTPAPPHRDRQGDNVVERKAPLGKHKHSKLHNLCHTGISLSRLDKSLLNVPSNTMTPQGSRPGREGESRNETLARSNAARREAPYPSPRTHSPPVLEADATPTARNTPAGHPEDLPAEEFYVDESHGDDCRSGQRNVRRSRESRDPDCDERERGSAAGSFRGGLGGDGGGVTGESGEDGGGPGGGGGGDGGLRAGTAGHGGGDGGGGGGSRGGRNGCGPGAPGGGGDGDNWGLREIFILCDDDYIHVEHPQDPSHPLSISLLNNLLQSFR
ncbi:hypothetical protein V5O48_001961 [Marasmius crinis-equi]|uniref:Uncharacterized protein n=1 Tax=Marasmius crinis-equi TaxID=585013 RepID=A0ABR3FWX4_9AGAR